jgi:hypothetical protein
MTLDDLVNELEACWIDPATASIEALADAVARRAEIVASLVAYDYATVDATERARVRDRLQAVVERDAEIGRVLAEGR